MIFARIIGVVSTILLLLFALASPMLLISLVLIVANGGVLVAIVIGTFPVPIFYLQRAARNCIETKSYSKIYPMLIIFAIYTVLLFFAVIKAQRMH